MRWTREYIEEALPRLNALTAMSWAVWLAIIDETGLPWGPERVLHWESPLCSLCVHYREWGESTGTCDVYPDGIPEPLWFGEHREPYEGDGGQTFKAVKDWELYDDHELIARAFKAAGERLRRLRDDAE